MIGILEDIFCLNRNNGIMFLKYGHSALVVHSDLVSTQFTPVAPYLMIGLRAHESDFDSFNMLDNTWKVELISIVGYNLHIIVHLWASSTRMLISEPIKERTCPIKQGIACRVVIQTFLLERDSFYPQLLEQI